LFFLIGIFLLISGEISKSQPIAPCPSGFSRIDIVLPVIYNGDTCEYHVIICYKCILGTAPPSMVEIMVHAMWPVDSTCLSDPNAVMNAIQQKINDPDWVYINIIPYCNNGWPPCEGNPPEPPIEVFYSYPICWQWDYFIFNEEPPYEWVKVKVAGCDCFCKWSKLFCWDGQKLVSIPGGQQPEQDVPCPCLDPEYPPEGPCWDEPSPCSQ
jgi:hypothetical protein